MTDQQKRALALLSDPRKRPTAHTRYLGHTIMVTLRQIWKAHQFNIVDVCCSDGRWSRSLVANLRPPSEEPPAVDRVCIDANPDYEDEFNRHAVFVPEGRETVFWKAAWNTSGKRLNMRHAGNPHLAEAWEADWKNGAESFGVETITVDDAVKASGYPGPYFLKIDGHGSDIRIIEGAEKVLEDTVGICFEANLLRITPTTKVFHEMLEEYHKRGFRPYWIGSPIHGRYGGTWEVECILLREGDDLFSELRGDQREFQQIKW